MKTPAIIASLTVAGSIATAVANPPVFTFSMEIRGSQSWICNYDPTCGCQNGNRPAPWMRIDSRSDGTETRTGTVPFVIEVVHSPNLVQWTLTTSTSDIINGNGCSDDCCGGDIYHSIPTFPSVACGSPMYPPFADFWSFYGCQQQRYQAAPSQSVIALNIPYSCGMPTFELLGYCMSGSVQYTFCRDDFDASGSIDGGDLGTLLAYWGYPYVWEVARLDLDDDGTISGADLGILLAHWGECAIPNG